MLLDPDFVYVSTIDVNPQDGLELEEDVEENVDEENVDGAAVAARRGKYVEWEEHENFENNTGFDSSDVKAKIKEFMTRRNTWKTTWATNENYSSNFPNKKVFKSCPRPFKVCFISTCFKIEVFSNMEEHCHQEDLDFVTAVNYHWTGPQQEVIKNVIKFGLKITTRSYWSSYVLS